MLKCDETSGGCGYEGNVPDPVTRKIWCVKCGRFYLASKEEIGEEPRTLKTTHKAITGAKRRAVLLRSSGFCELCGRKDQLQVGHLVSVERGHEYGLTDDEINHTENLCAMCPECNSNMRSEVVPLRVALVMIRDRARRAGQ